MQIWKNPTGNTTAQDRSPVPPLRGKVKRADLDAHIADILLHSSGKEVAYAENVTAVAYPLTTATVALAGCSIVVPQSIRPQYLSFSFWVDVTTAPAATKAGMVGSNVIDEAGTVWGGDILPFEASGDTASFAQLQGEFRIPPNTPQHTYTVYANRSGDSAFRASVVHGGIGQAFRSYIACRTA